MAKRLTKKMYDAIAALLTCDTPRQAAAMAGVSERVLRQWRAENPAFQEELTRARRLALDDAVNALHRLARSAHRTLRRAMRCNATQADPRRTACEVRAAGLVLEHVFKASEWADINSRLDLLEQERRA